MSELDAGVVLAGKYEIVRFVGDGALGEVYEALQRRLKRRVALKVVKRVHRENPDVVQRFLREGEVQARLRHEHIVQIYDAEECRDGPETIPFLVMEFVDGDSLQQQFDARGPSGVADGCRIALPLARALAYAAAQDPPVVHRDVKPANVMVDSQGVVKLGDFGLARFVDETGNGHSTICGTPSCMPPEQWGTGTALGPPADVYALGCTLYKLVCGRFPFGRPFRSSHLEDTPPLLSERVEGVPGWLDELVAAMLAKEPHDRKTAAEVADELERRLDCPAAPSAEAHPAGLLPSKDEGPGSTFPPASDGAAAQAQPPADDVAAEVTAESPAPVVSPGELLAAAVAGDLLKVESLLDAGVDPDLLETDPETPLHKAASRGHVAVVRALLDRGADLEAASLSGGRALHFAALNGHEAVVRELLNRGAELEATNEDGSRALFIAALSGHASVVQVLLDRGAKIEAAREKDGWRALHAAAAFGQETTVRLLLHRGAEPKPGRPGRTSPRQLAERNGHTAVAELLRSRGG